MNTSANKSKLGPVRTGLYLSFIMTRSLLILSDLTGVPACPPHSRRAVKNPLYNARLRQKSTICVKESFCGVKAASQGKPGPAGQSPWKPASISCWGQRSQRLEGWLFLPEIRTHASTQVRLREGQRPSVCKAARKRTFIGLDLGGKLFGPVGARL